MAVRALTAEQPLALLIDDMQWADEDSLRLLRYVIRTEGTSPIFVMFSIRPEELASLTEAVTLIADMERMRVIRRLKLARFSVVETSEFLRQLLGGQVDPTTASTIHGQAEGRAVHRRGDRPRLPRGRDAAADGREVDARAQRRTAGAVGGPHADPATGGASPPGVEDRTRGSGVDGEELQPEGSAGGSSAYR